MLHIHNRTSFPLISPPLYYPIIIKVEKRHFIRRRRQKRVLTRQTVHHDSKPETSVWNNNARVIIHLLITRTRRTAAVSQISYPRTIPDRPGSPPLTGNPITVSVSTVKTSRVVRSEHQTSGFSKRAKTLEHLGSRFETQIMTTIATTAGRFKAVQKLTRRKSLNVLQFYLATWRTATFRLESGERRIHVYLKIRGDADHAAATSARDKQLNTSR